VISPISEKYLRFLSWTNAEVCDAEVGESRHSAPRHDESCDDRLDEKHERAIILA